MNRRTAAAAVAAAALVLSPVAAGTADAKPTTKGASAKASAKKAAAKTQVKQLVNDIRVKDRALARVATSSKVVGLADENEAVLVDNISFDREELAAVRAEALADSTFNAKAARVTVRTYRVEIYTQAADVVRDVEELSLVATEDVEALELLDLALESALALTARSPKADVETAKQYVVAAEAELADVDDTDVEPEPEPEPEQPVV